MKHLIIGLLLFLSFGEVSAQDTKAPEYVYCEIIGIDRIFSTKVSVFIDYGQETRFFQDNRIRDEESGKVKKFNSMVDAMNFMSERGWEFVQAFVVGGKNENVYHWLLKRKLTDEQKKNYIPPTKQDIQPGK